MTEIELNGYIDTILKLFAKDIQVNNRFFLTPELRKVPHDRVIPKMLEFELIKTVNEFGVNHTWELTPFGHKVLQYESWTRFRELTHKKELNDSLISEHLVNTKWWPHWFSGLAILISVFSLFVSVRQCEQGQPRINDEMNELNNGAFPTARKDTLTVKSTPTEIKTDSIKK